MNVWIDVIIYSAIISIVITLGIVALIMLAEYGSRR